MLKIQDLVKQFGGLKAINKISLTVKEGDFIGLIGPNGSGKTTLFNVISGHLKSNSGNMSFRDQDITGLSSDKVCHLGIARTFQIPRPFKSMTVVENVMESIFFGSKNIIRSSSTEQIRQEAIKCLNFVGLDVDDVTMPSELTGAGLRNLELARALSTKPELLLVDEYMSGLNREEILKACLTLKQIHEEMGITMIWVEHVMGALMKIVKKVVVLQHGEVIAEGEPLDISKNEKVIEAYFGEKEA
jgi:branched-chain amino acid transport system ATP-binding protein